jgi:hypothetical protein
MEQTVNVIGCAHPSFFNPGIINMLGLSATPVIEHNRFHIGLQSMSKCARYIAIPIVTVKSTVTVEFHDDKNFQAPATSLVLKLERTYSQISEVTEMMHLFLTQGISALYKYPEIRKLYEEASVHTSEKMARNSSYGAKMQKDFVSFPKPKE